LQLDLDFIQIEIPVQDEEAVVSDERTGLGLSGKTQFNFPSEDVLNTFVVSVNNSIDGKLKLNVRFSIKKHKFYLFSQP